ncbi:MAG: hypothetical protein IAG13_14355, partial [Deltaproteobacteria bacterium]|nr:hypothetical protein [Nannocystaceae bacterium]
PAGLLPASLFDRAQSWTLPPDANMAVLESDAIGCRVAMIDADAFAPRVVFWSADDLPIQVIAGEGEVAGAGAIELVVDHDGRGRYEASEELVFAPGEAREPTGVCAMQDDAERVDWGDHVPVGNLRVQAVVPGVDGCTAIDLVAITGDHGERMYLCTPPLELPFAVGDAVQVRREYASSSESVVITQLGDDLQPAQPLAELWVSRGAEAPALPGLELSVVPVYGCEWASDPCGAAVRGVSVVLGGPGYDAAQLSIGVATTSGSSEGDTWTVTLAHGQERAVLDDECSVGPDGLGYDIEMVAVHHGAQE